MNPVGTHVETSRERIFRLRESRLVRASVWVLSGIVGLYLLLVVAGAIVLHTTAFHNYALNKLREVASEQLGTQVDLENFDVNLSRLSVDIYGLSIHGAAPYVNPPLLQVQHAQVGVRIVSILHRKWYLNNLRIDQPVAKVFTDANGNTNIPKLKSTGGNSQTSVFDLGIRHAVLNNGEVYYNDRHSSLAADLHNVDFRAAFQPVTQKYSGRLSYQDGHLTTGSTQTFTHSLNAAFDATPSTFHLSSATLITGGSKAVLSATVQNYSDPDVQAQYDLIVDGRDVRQILNNPSIPAGLIQATGSAHYHAIPNRPALDAVALDGNLNSRQLDIRTASVRGRISNVSAQYSLENGNAILRSLKARLLGGAVEATGAMYAIAGESAHSEVNASLQGISLRDIQGSLHTSALPKNVTITGTMSSQLKASWGSTIGNLLARADATVNGRISGSENGTPMVMPLNGAVHGNYSNASQQIALSQTYLQTPQTTLTMNGIMSRHSDVAIKLQANDLREVETLADLFRTPAPGQPVQPLGLAGTATFNGTLGGSTAAPDLKGQLVAQNLQIHGTTWRSVRTGLDVSPSLARLQNAVLEPAPRGRIVLDGSVGLSKWSFANTSPIQVSLNASGLDVAELTKTAGQQIPVTGVLAMNVNMHGTELHPVGQGNLSLTRVMAYNEPVRSAQLVFSGTGDEVHGKLEVSLPAGNLNSTISVRPSQKSFVAQVSAINVRLEKLETLKARNLDLNGGLTLQANGRGTFDSPQVDASLQLPKLLVQNQEISAVKLKMNMANHIATADLSSQAVDTSIRANAKVNLTGDYLADATVDTQPIPLQPLAAIYVPAQAASISGQTELHATLHGPLKKTSLLEAHVTVPMLSVGYGKNVQLAAASPIHVDLKNNIIAVQRGAIRGTDTDLQFQGSVPITGNASMSLLLLGTVNLRLAQMFDPDLTSSGQIKFNINSYGATRDPNVQGQIEIVDAGLATADLPVGLQHGNGVLTLTRDRLNISRFQGVVGSGLVTAQGGIAYRPNLQFDLGLSAKDIRVLYPQGVRENVNANIRLAGTPENAVLGGTVDLADLSFTPSFDLTNFISQFSGEISPPPSPGISQNIQLNLAVRSSNNINLVSRTLSVNGTANLQVRGTAAQPVILGRINLNSGDLIFNGDRFVLNGGTIQFVNPSQTEPVVNLALNTTVQEYSINMRFTGPIDQLHTEYASDPSLPAADIINLLAFGKTTEANSPDAATPASQQAASLVASQVSSQVTSRISKVAGISQLSINPVLAGGSTEGPPGANITIQQRVTGNFFFTFSSNLATTQQQTIMGQYQVTPRVAVSGTRDQNGGFGFDTTIKKTW
ncbi:MAG: translocation/assembly module TamB domain-containing protein [Acidobacteriaceae bacterium]|nr:translocation/assembly module TamB domain-containing protein [Acidobacteriaceae bacterium]